MGFPDRIERTAELAHPPGRVWAVLTMAEGWPSWPATSMPPDVEAVAEQVLVALADPSRRAILAARNWRTAWTAR